VLGSREALEVKQIPKKLAVIGGGFIGLELGTFFSKLGTQVTVLEASDQLLPGTDRECVDVVAKKLQRKGVKVHLNTKAKSFAEHASGGLLVQAQGSGPDQVTVEADWILLTVGRKPRTDKLGLETVGLKVNSRGQIDVNARLETSVPGLFAIGDIVGGPMLAHKASKEGLIAVESFVNPAAAMNIVALPWAIFVDPEIASVGHTEESARAAGWTPVIAKCPFGAIGRALTTGSAEGFVKLVVDQKTDRVLGAHMVGPEVSNLVAEVALGIEMGATAQDIARTVHAHPTLPEGIMEAAEAVHGMAIHFFEKKKPVSFDAKASV
jgi:dihydrolipoamide dehydrogenase